MKFKLGNIAVVLFLLSLAACGKGESNKTSTQVAAKVNSDEISMHQINQVIKNTKDVTAENAPVVRQQILEKLIDQQIIVEKAVKDSLDRTPDVMMAIESAKKDILARAYLQKLVADKVKISDSEVKEYYDTHPELFSKRRIYNLQDIGVEKNDEANSVIAAAIEQNKSMQEIVDLLKSKEIKYSAGAYTRPAEQIPLEILPNLQKANDGEMLSVTIANSLHAIKIIKTQDAPIDLAAATPFIKNYFVNTRGKQFIEDEMKKFRSEAKVEYFGAFSKSAANTPASAAETVSDKPKSNKKSEMDEGIAGLK